MFKEQLKKLEKVRDVVDEEAVDVIQTAKKAMKDLETRGFTFKVLPPDFLKITDKEYQQILEKTAKDPDAWDLRGSARGDFERLLFNRIIKKVNKTKVYKLHIQSRRGTSTSNRCLTSWDIIEQVVIERKSFYERNWDVIAEDIIYESDIFGTTESARLFAEASIIKCADFQQVLIKEAQRDYNAMISHIGNIEIMDDLDEHEGGYHGRF